MKRNLNFTGRIRIPWEDIQLELRPEADGLRITGSIDLSCLDAIEPTLREQAALVIEVYDSGRQSSRVALGSAIDLSQGRVDVSGTATSIANHQALLCRVRVVQSPAPGATVGRILAAADRIRPASEGPRQGLLPFRSAELDGPVWRLSTEGAPEVQIEQGLDDWQRVGRSHHFQALVMPVIAREIAAWLIHRLQEDDGVEEQPVQQWLSFYSTLGFDISAWQEENESSERDVVDDYLDGIQSAFARRHRLVELYPKPEGDE